MPHHSTELSIAARFAELSALLDSLSAQAACLGVSASDMSRIQLVVEELVSNSITHGYGGECDQLLTVALRAKPDGVTLVFGDQAPPFDLSRMTASEPDEDQIGGLGINLILGFARQIRYRRVGNSNITEIDL
jgi:anti-sigma regulatory factor (Ser/Thr protein kinase)